MKRKGILFCLVGPAGGGKTTIGQALLGANSGTLVQSVSVTSRPARPGEVPGESYTFISRSDFEKKIKDKFFVESEEVHGNFYGTPRGNIDRALKGEIDVLLIIDIKGARNIKKMFPQAAVIAAVLPPSFADLKKRILARGQIEKSDLEARLATARREYKEIETLSGDLAGLDYLVVNAKLEEAERAVQSILLAERSKPVRFESGSIKALCETEGIGLNLSSSAC